MKGDGHLSPTDNVTIRRGRPVGDREARRIELLNAGVQVIAELGLGGASLRKVAKKAGYTTGAVTYYFANKEQLFAAIVEYMFQRFDEMLYAGEDIGDYRRRFEHWFDINADSFIWPAGFQLLTRARHDAELAAIYRDTYAQYRRITTRRIEAQQKSGTIRDDISAELLAEQIAALADGWAMMLPIEPDRFTPERVDRLLDALLRQMAPSRS
ncbi:TetR/AcrR family transcriptional regulator [Sphingopyxis sp. KK2]|uniref:TetR/AcrR family transcriptional regulator n=1 Tax=Sphingopyxis sp. KK2 TaxID=1855727 RepID=UPI00097E5B07|nr:TetR/AcrR family transcriptional regulator [Sphingopyxis sp. KK2]